MSFDPQLPPVLAALHALDFDYADGEGIDFEPYQEFQSAEDNAAWIQAWTGNQALTGAEYRVFGQDGSGGLAAFWLVRPDVEVLAQPIVFFGSEGELGVVASSFVDYLWLLAAGIGPLEAVSYGPGGESRPQPALAKFAAEHGGPARRAVQVLVAANAAFPDFEAQVRAQCA